MSANADSSAEFFYAQGTLDPTRPCYVSRPADQQLLDHLVAGDFCYVLTSRQKGKSSLMARISLRLREAGTRTAIVDLTAIGDGAKAKGNPSTWYFGLAQVIASDVAAGGDLSTWWHQRDGLPELQRFKEFLEHFILGQTTAPVVIFVDEIDATLNLDFTDDFFAGIRACSNARAHKSVFKRLTFCLLGVATPAELIKDSKRTPFNIGHRIDLTDFTPDLVGPLAAGLPMSPVEAGKALTRILYWTAGQPYLTQKLCIELSKLEARPATTTMEARVDGLVEDLFFAGKTARDEVHFQNIETRIRQHREKRRILNTYRQVLAKPGQIPGNPQSTVHNALLLAGLVGITPDGALGLRNRIYDHHFNEGWVRKQLAADPALNQAGFRGATVSLLLLLPLGYGIWTRSEAGRSRLLVQSLINARPEAVAEAAARLTPVRARVRPLLWREFTSAPEESSTKLNAALALAHLGEVQSAFLLDRVAAGATGQCTNLIHALEASRGTVLPELSRRIRSATNATARARLATVALFLGNQEPLRAMTQPNPNPVDRTAFIHGFRDWRGFPTALADLLESSRIEAAAGYLRSAIGAALALTEWSSWNSGEQSRLCQALRQVFIESPDGGSHSAAESVLNRWGQPRPELPPRTNHPPAGRDWFVNLSGMTMLRVPAGRFWMGDPESIFERDVGQVTLTRDIFMADREVTVELFRSFEAEARTNTHFPALERLDWESETRRVSPSPDCPVQSVNWFDAVKFCNWLSRREGRTPCYAASSPTNWIFLLDANGYRLPTDAEWEYSCRAGSETSYSFGDDPMWLGDYAWFADNSLRRTWACGSKLPNLLGLFDLHGNVWEWCQDWYSPLAEVLRHLDDPTGPSHGEYRMLRGGSWADVNAYYLRAAGRFGRVPGLRNSGYGFRVVAGGAR